MRITQNMLSQQFLYNVTLIDQRLQNEETEVSTGKSLNEPSDNPLAVSQDMSIRETISQTTGYQSAISAGLTWMDNSESAISNIISGLQSVQENVTSALNATDESTAGWQALTDTTKQYISGIYQTLNTKQDDRYLFSGAQTGTAAYDTSTSTVQTDTSSLNYEVSQGVDVPVNVTASSMFLSTSASPVNLQQTLSNVVSDMQSKNSSALQTDLQNLTDNLQNVININAELGSRVQRLTSLQTQMTQYANTLTNQKGVIEDANMAQVSVQYNTDQTVYEAALKMGSEILLPTLVSYLPNG